MSLDDRWVNLVEEGFDLAIRIGQRPDSSLIAPRFGPCRHVVCCTKGYFRRQGVSRSLEALHDHYERWPPAATAAGWHPRLD
jgi:DNA-binding transcriptional LysR family regulator